MRAFFLLFLLTSSVGSGFCQSKAIHAFSGYKSDSTVVPAWTKELEADLALQSIATYSTNFYLRFWRSGQVLEIWESNHKRFGKLTNWGNEYIHSKGIPKPHHNIYYLSENLDSTETQNIYNLVLSSGLQNVPSQYKIKGWKDGLDGETFDIEYGNATDYYIKSYWTPSAFPNIQEAVQILDFFNKAFSAANAKSKYGIFLNRIPFKCWSNGGNIICKAHRWQFWK